jgi:predicted small lipoprotein YifL
LQTVAEGFIVERDPAVGGDFGAGENVPIVDEIGIHESRLIFALCGVDGNLEFAPAAEVAPDERRDASGDRGKKRTSKRDPSSRKALLWMTAKGGLGGRTGGLGEEGRLNPHLLVRSARSAAPGKAIAKAPTSRER